MPTPGHALAMLIVCPVNGRPLAFPKGPLRGMTDRRARADEWPLSQEGLHVWEASRMSLDGRLLKLHPWRLMRSRSLNCCIAANDSYVEILPSNPCASVKPITTNRQWTHGFRDPQRSKRLLNRLPDHDHFTALIF